LRAKSVRVKIPHRQASGWDVSVRGVEECKEALVAAANSVMSAAYAALDARLKSGGIVILDGGIGSELQVVGYPERAEERPKNFTWGSIAIAEAPDKLREVHRRYAAAGADVLETHTFALNRVYSALQDGRITSMPRDGWKGLALDSVRLVREGAALAGRDDIAVAFSCRTMDWPPLMQHEARDLEGTYVPLEMEGYLKPLAELLANADDAHRPDLILMEIQKEIPESLDVPDYQLFLDTGIPLWISYRRTVGKIVGVDGEDILIDGDRFGHAAKKFEEMGVSAVLVNCLPAEQVHGVASWLRGFTNLPLGAYPNWGHYLRYEWDWSDCPGPEVFAEHARRWAAEGMQIIGGCCGARPVEIEALVESFRAPAGVR
jgi:S-methylmethionine-dependent homocysteine/selenocysteine methylase